MTLIKDDGFHADDLADVTFETLADGGATPSYLDVDNSIDPADLAAHLSAKAIRIPFPSFADGRGFSIARQLRSMGYTGRLRAVGHLISDQYLHARRAGFDEIEIDDAVAARQPAAQWLAVSNWDKITYQDRLRAAG